VWRDDTKGVELDLLIAKPIAGNRDASERVRKRAERLVSRGYLGKAVRILDSDGVADMTEAVREQLSGCFPESKEDHGNNIDEIPDTLPPFVCDVDTTARHTRKCTSGSSAGVSGWRGEYITPFLGDAEIAEAWHQLILLLGNGKLPDWTHPYLCDARGVALFKPKADGVAREPGNFRDGDRVRPIAAGEFIMRVASSIGCELDRDQVVKHLAPVQLGIGVPGGAEVVAWTLRHVLACGPTIIVCLDEGDAFQHIHRAKAVNAALKIAPNCARMIAFEYMYPPAVHFAGKGTHYTFSSQTGVKQGHGFGSLVYASGKDAVYKEMAAFSESVGVSTYLDNAYIASRDPDALRQVLDVWDKGTRALGGKPNYSKCLIYYNHDSLEGIAKALGDELHIEVLGPDEGFEACGIPLGSPDYIHNQLNRKLDRHERLFGHLTQLDPQCANLILRNAGVPRMSFLLRGVPFDELTPFAQRFDETIEKVFREIADLNKDQASSRLLQAGFRHGGFGLARQSPLAAGANLASLLLSFPVLAACFDVTAFLADYEASADLEGKMDSDDLAEAWILKAQACDLHFIVWIIEAWQQLKSLGLPDGALPHHPMELIARPKGFFDKMAERLDNPHSFRIQRFLSHLHAEQVDQRLQAELASQPTLAARNLSNRHSGATAWLRIVPVRRSLRFTPSEFRAVARIFSGARPRALPNVPCKCKAELTLAHALSCRHLRGRFLRHDALVEDVFQWLRRRRIHSVKETYVSDKGEDRVDIWVRADSTVMWCDVTVTDPSCKSIVAAAAKNVGAAAKRADGQKRSAWRDLAEAENADVVPLVFETSGRRGTALEKFLREMERASEDDGPSKRELLDQLSITVQKFNVAMIREAGQKAMGVRKGKRRFMHVRGRVP
jgi:hypothetical protein